MIMSFITYSTVADGLSDRSHLQRWLPAKERTLRGEPSGRCVVIAASLGAAGLMIEQSSSVPEMLTAWTGRAGLSPLNLL